MAGSAPGIKRRPSGHGGTGSRVSCWNSPPSPTLLPFLRDAHQAICLVVIYLAAFERCCPQTPHPCSSSCCAPRWRLSGPQQPLSFNTNLLYSSAILMSCRSDGGGMTVLMSPTPVEPSWEGRVTTAEPTGDCRRCRRPHWEMETSWKSSTSSTLVTAG